MNNDELARSSIKLTATLRQAFADCFLLLPPMNEQERFFIVMQSMSAFCSSMIDALIDDKHPEKKMEILDEFFRTSKLLMEHKFKLEKEIYSAGIN